MSGRCESNPFEEEEQVNPFSGGGGKGKTGKHTNFGGGSYTTVFKQKERELQAKEAELKRREQEVRRREEAIARAGIVLEEKNWPPFLSYYSS